jgi:calcineurin-like phosphoesterase family protein
MRVKAFYSDPHFGHKNIIKYAGRPFADVPTMNQGLIDRYNAVIDPDDTVMWLGDCAFMSSKKFKEIMERLNGRKLLIRGNHDHSPGKMVKMGFDLVLDECHMVIADRICRLKHYPYLDGEPQDCRHDDRYADRRPPKVDGEILIHGHTHSAIKFYKNMVHVGVDAWNCGPALYEEVEAIIRKQFPA